jgi:hypothetical protein
VNNDKCTQCNGKKKIPTTGSALYWPDRFPDEFMDCPKCSNLPQAIDPTESANEVEAV